VAAQFVHYGSTRRDGAFVKVNCAAIPEGLIESELFGHVRGAFTDAKTDRAGKFQQASGGTLFLDEVGELPPGVQSKLLRAIETGEIQQLGSEKSVHADVRIVAATNRDLAALVQGRQFREDLYYRLNVFAVRVPPLREHQEDLPELAEGFLSRFCRENGLAALHFSTKAFTALKAHAWPGNVRELRNVVQRCALECDGSEIGSEEVAAVLSAAI
jgi:transcriptional regulator with GAF, ATPase, and Fis domain